MYIDMHTHSVSSDDSRATVEQYAQWVTSLKEKGYQIDGFVLTEHRRFDQDVDYSALSKEHGILILKGSELDTRYGHFLVYGVTEGLTRDIDFSDVRMDARQLMQGCPVSRVAATESNGAHAQLTVDRLGDEVAALHIAHRD